MIQFLLLLISLVVADAQCPPGVKGERCDMCMDNFYNPTPSSVSIYCAPCACNNNHDPYYPGAMCNNMTGDCNRCVHHTKGKSCEVCDDDFFGDAKSRSCQRCHCNSCGRDRCDPVSGVCTCKQNVVGQHCDECLPEHFGLNSCEGCKPCDCSPTGSWCNDCHPETGNCKCKPGVTGRKCNQCLPSFWSFSENGCIPCQCPNQRSVNKRVIF